MTDDCRPYRPPTYQGELDKKAALGGALAAAWARALYVPPDDLETREWVGYVVDGQIPGEEVWYDIATPRIALEYYDPLRDAEHHAEVTALGENRGWDTVIYFCEPTLFCDLPHDPFKGRTEFWKVWNDQSMTLVEALKHRDEFRDYVQEHGDVDGCLALN